MPQPLQVPAMIVCVCHRISDRDIARHAQQGIASFDELQMESGVSTCCGKCESCARDTFEQARQHHTIALIRNASEFTQAAKMA